MKPPAKSPKAAKSAPLPPGAHRVPGSAFYRKSQGQKVSPPVVLDKSFVSDPRGGPEKVIGRSAVHVKDNRTVSKR
jgi:hypothetical protein